MTNLKSSDQEMPQCPAQTDKAKAIRRKYCLENNKVFEFPFDDYTYFEKNGEAGEEYLCFEEDELDVVVENGKAFFIKRYK